MDKFLLNIIIGFTVMILFISCGAQPPVKQEVKLQVKQETNQVQTAPPGKIDDLSFENVMAVLKSSLDAEKANNNSTTKLDSAKAYMLLIKFIHTDKDKVVKSGMTSEDVNFLVNDAKEKAQLRLNDIIGDPTAPAGVKNEARARMNEIGSL